MTLVIRTELAMVWQHATTVTIGRSRAYLETGCQLSVRAHHALEAMVVTHHELGGGGDVPK
jgi:hypothetical protein